LIQFENKTNFAIVDIFRFLLRIVTLLRRNIAIIISVHRWPIVFYVSESANLGELRGCLLLLFGSCRTKCEGETGRSAGWGSVIPWWHALAVAESTSCQV